MTDPEKLLPCPCCQSTNLVPAPKHWPDGVVYCRDCGLRANSPEAWNTRQPPAPQDDMVLNAIKAAYWTGCEDVHDAWIRGDGQDVADFGEAASDYAASVDLAPIIAERDALRELLSIALNENDELHGKRKNPDDPHWSVAAHKLLDVKS